MAEPLYKTKAEKPEWLKNLCQIHAAEVLQFKKIPPSQLFNGPACNPCTLLNTEEYGMLESTFYPKTIVNISEEYTDALSSLFELNRMMVCVFDRVDCVIV